MKAKTKAPPKRKWGFKHTAKKLVASAQKYVTDRYAPKSGLSVANLASDLAALKLLVNVEKKRYVQTSDQIRWVGQLNGDTSGHATIYITPLPTQGDGYNQRNGNSLKLISQYMSFQFAQMANQHAPVKVYIDIWKTNGIPVTIANYANLVGDLYKVNQWLFDLNSSAVIYDTNSAKNPDYHGTCRKLRTVTFTIGGDTIANQTKQISKTIKMKYGFHVRFDGNTTGLTQGEIFIVMRCDRGNINGTTASTLTGVSDTAINTGLTYLYNITSYYVDN